jgi:hypothetical protein
MSLCGDIFQIGGFTKKRHKRKEELNLCRKSVVRRDCVRTGFSQIPQVFRQKIICEKNAKYHDNEN